MGPHLSSLAFASRSSFRSINRWSQFALFWSVQLEQVVCRVPKFGLVTLLEFDSGKLSFDFVCKPFSFCQQNISRLISRFFICQIFDSVWKLLKGNVSVLFSTCYALISLLLSGSSVILNTTLSFVRFFGLLWKFFVSKLFCFFSKIVFLTSLFYLLASSNDQYRPLEMAGSMIIHITGSDSSSVLRFEKAVEDSIRRLNFDDNSFELLI